MIVSARWPQTRSEWRYPPFEPIRPTVPPPLPWPLTEVEVRASGGSPVLVKPTGKGDVKNVDLTVP